MDTVTIRRATREDADTLIGLIQALADFEHLAGPDAGARDRLIADGFDAATPRFEAWLAEDTTGAIGYALYFFTYSTFLCQPSLYLEDIFVKPDQRSQGVGKRLLLHCLNVAKERGCGRAEWSVLDWNNRAQDFYKSLGAVAHTEWHLYGMTADVIAQVLAGDA